MKVVVFGGAGFLGSHVADVLTEEGHKVVIFDLKETPHLKEGQVSIVGDILDEKAVDKAVEGCEVVYNFAGIADMDEAKHKPLDTVKNNVLGNAILLDAAARHRLKRFIFASTLYVYSKAGSFYRSSKQSCELLIENYQAVRGLDFTILRYGSLYGPRANQHNWIYQILNQALTEKKIVREGDGEELREYIHVYDAARLSVDALSDNYRNQYVIITGSQQIKVRDFLNMIKEMMDNQIEIEYNSAGDNDHYEITPFNFKPRLAKRIISDHYIDLGEGILDILQTFYDRYAYTKK